MTLNLFSIHTPEEGIHLNGLRGLGRDTEAGVGECVLWSDNKYFGFRQLAGLRDRAYLTSVTTEEELPPSMHPQTGCWAQNKYRNSLTFSCSKALIFLFSNRSQTQTSVL